MSSYLDQIRGYFGLKTSNQIDCERKYKILVQLTGNLFHLFETECHWKFFREEMFNDSHSGQNAKIMSDFIKDFSMKHPEIMKELRGMYDTSN